MTGPLIVGWVARRPELVRAGMFVAGSFFAILLAVAVWPFRPYHPVRAAVAASWMAVGDLAAAAAKVASSPADAAAWESLVPLRRRARDALEDAREALAVARAGRDGETGRGLQLLVLYEILRSEEHTSELQSRLHLVCRLLLEKKKKNKTAR